MTIHIVNPTTDTDDYDEYRSERLTDALEVFALLVFLIAFWGVLVIVALDTYVRVTH